MARAGLLPRELELSTRAAALALLSAVAVLFPTTLAGQEGCEFAEGSGDYRREAIPGGGAISYVGTPHFVCEDGVEIWADSAVAYSQLGMAHLMGSVRYHDRTRELRADTARYFSEQGRLQANGHVRVHDEREGSRIENGALVYMRETAFRPVETMTVTTGPDGVRPRAVLTPARPDSAPADAPPPAPYTVIGDRIFVRGDSYFSSAGNVEIERDSLFAFADSVEYDEELDHLLLDGSARVITSGNELVGRVITISTPGAAASRIHALREAVLTGADMMLRSPEIFVFLVDGTLDRLVATPIVAAEGTVPDSADLVRPVATVEDFELTADSLDVIAPAEVIERVVAVGDARSVSSSSDSLNVDLLPEVARSDWLRGDTVTIVFRPVGSVAADSAAPVTDTAVAITDTATATGTPSPPVDPVPAVDTAEGAFAGEEPASGEGADYEVDRIIARGNASSLYRLVPSDSAAVVGTDPPALHYVVGSEITVTMADGEIDELRVVGQTRGVHLEPLPPRTVADSANMADTLSIPRDTSVVRGRVENAPSKPRAPTRKTPREHREDPWRRR